MSIVFVLLPVSVLLAAVAVGGFVWSVRRGQLDDLVTPAVRMLDDDEPPLAPDVARSARRRDDVR